jgi:ribonuclease E
MTTLPAATVVAQVEAVQVAEPRIEAVVTPEPAPYTSVANEERVVEYAPAQPPSTPIARDPIVLPSDLIQIETDTEKLRVASGRVAPPPPPRPARVRPPLPPISSEPLVQIETQK